MIDIENLKRIASFFAQIMGSQTEIVIHDITTGEIVWIANGAITGRNIGMHEESITLHFLMDEAIVAKTDDMRIGYRSATRHGRNLRSSQIFMRDENNNVRYVMCINQDITSINMMQGYLNSFCEALNLTPANAIPAPAAQAPKTEDRTIDAVTTQVILEEIERAKPFTLDSKEARTNILRALDEKGVFEVRYAVSKTCELLQIAQATLYKYLKEIRSTPSEPDASDKKGA